MKKNLRRSSTRSGFSKFNYFLVIIGIALLLLFAWGNNTSKFTNNPLIPSPTLQPYDPITYITPVITDSNQKNWKTFIYPNNHYSFSFPEEWRLYEWRYNFEKIDESSIYLFYQENNREYKLEFMSGGRGGPNYDELKTKAVYYAGRVGKEDTYFLNGKPFEVVVSFPNSYKNDPFVGINMQLPQTNTEKYLNLFHQVLSTLRFSS